MLKLNRFFKLFAYMILGVVLLAQFLRRQVNVQNIGMCLFFLVLLNYWFLVLNYHGKTSNLEPLWGTRLVGVGVGINPKNPFGFWLLTIGVAVLMIVIGILLLMSLSR